MDESVLLEAPGSDEPSDTISEDNGLGVDTVSVEAFSLLSVESLGVAALASESGVPCCICGVSFGLSSEPGTYPSEKRTLFERLNLEPLLLDSTELPLSFDGLAPC